MVGLGDRGVVRDTLRATLVKAGEDVETFDRLFDAYFGLHPEPTPKPLPVALTDHDHGDPPAASSWATIWRGRPRRRDARSHSLIASGTERRRERVGAA